MRIAARGAGHPIIRNPLPGESPIYDSDLPNPALVIADIMRGTGRYNLARGAIASVQGIGASLSGLVAGVIVDHFGYSVAFLAAGAAAAVVALAVFALGMPETAQPETTGADRLSTRNGRIGLPAEAPGGTTGTRGATLLPSRPGSAGVENEPAKVSCVPRAQ